MLIYDVVLTSETVHYSQGFTLHVCFLWKWFFFRDANGLAPTVALRNQQLKNVWRSQWYVYCAQAEALCSQRVRPFVRPFVCLLGYHTCERDILKMNEAILMQN